MSQENVELVRSLLPGPDLDIVQFVDDDAVFAAWAEQFHPEFESVAHFPGDEPAIFAGPDGMRALWVDWTAPWATYRTQIDDVIDAAERVVVLVRDFGRRHETTTEVELISASVLTVRDGKLARVDFYTDRTSALKAAGLEE